MGAVSGLAVTADDFDVPAIQLAIGACLKRCGRAIVWSPMWGGGYVAPCRCGWRWTWEGGSDLAHGVRSDWSSAPKVSS